MRSSLLPLEQYDSDKIASRYLDKYDPFFEPLAEKQIKLLELGVLKGGSLLLWRDYFPLGTIVGIDICLSKDFKPADRIHVFEGSQTDCRFLSDVANKTAPDGFDIIIDDASHIGELTKTSFWHLLDNHLKPGGLYVIEDWGTGYWDEWPDGRNLDLETYSHPVPEPGFMVKLWSKLTGQPRPKTAMQGHNYGMPGFIKQLIDEQAACDVTRKRVSKFEQITIVQSLVFIKKAGNTL
ncbi:MAG: class I SAM-dependent methyltransferase [Lentisphaerota bacterium]